MQSSSCSYVKLNKIKGFRGLFCLLLMLMIWFSYSGKHFSSQKLKPENKLQSTSFDSMQTSSVSSPSYFTQKLQHCGVATLINE